MSKTVTIPPEVKAALKRCTYSGNVLKLPTDHLDCYPQLKKVVMHLGGTWKGGKIAGFQFTEDPKPLIEAALGEGKVVNHQQTTQFFPTPRRLAHYMASMLELNEKSRVLEPSAGEGALISAVLDEYSDLSPIHFFELEPKRVNHIKRTFGDKVCFVGNDFLAFTKANLAFDRIIMNPPFSGGQDIKHVTHAFSLLEPGGKLVSITFPGWLTHKTSAASEFRHLVERNGYHEEIEAGTFSEAGTDIETLLVVMDKP